MSFMPGLNVITDKVPELLTPRGLLRAVATFAGLAAVLLLGLIWLDGRAPFTAVLAQLVLYGANHFVLSSFFRGREERLPYTEAFFNRFLIAAAINVASLGYVYATAGGDVAGVTPRLVPGALAWLLALYLLASAALLFGRGVAAAGFDTLLGVYIYYPDEGRRVEGSVYRIVRHPVYGAIDRLALALALLNGTPLALLLGLFFIAVWHPDWYQMEERELTQRFGEEYRAYMQRVPATTPSSLSGELALWEALTQRVRRS